MTQQADGTRLRNADGSGRGTLVHVSAQVVKLFGEQLRADAAEHQQLWVDALRSLNGDGFSYEGNVFVAIRITEGGIGREIPFTADTPVELQGMFIPVSEATPGADDPGLAVLHFTHAPVGFVVYDGVTYR